jgi:predicted ATPase with chaperone activity
MLSASVELAGLSDALRDLNVVVASPRAAIPRMPASLEEAGVSAALVHQIALKCLYYRGEITTRDLTAALGLKFQLIRDILENFKADQYLEVKRSTGGGVLSDLSSILAITETGRERAKLYLDVNQYAGPVPVPLKDYTSQVMLQKRATGWLRFEALQQAYRSMVITPDILWQIGPAVNSGSSFLIYGKPGDGKTYLAESLAEIDPSPIFMPYSIEHMGSIIQIYDPLYHVPFDKSANPDLEELQPACDGRWLRCRRPFIVSGGELTMEMLEMSYNPISKVYEAPLQTKANNGIYLVDDFGRQLANPTEVLNRWIVPMDRHQDYLRLQTGGKIIVPFETFLVFSTNLEPGQLGDEAFLRRLRYKLLMRGPDEEEYREIFRRCCVENDFSFEECAVERFIDKHYRRTNKPFRRCQPRDVIGHAVDLVEFSRGPRELTDDVLDHAFESCFVTEALE